MWSEGDGVLLRGVYKGHPTYVQSARMVKDAPEEMALAVWPGAECVAPAGYIHNRHGDHSSWDRWQETLTNSLRMERYIWHSNRLLLILEPQKYYSTIYFWDDGSGEFLYYYINFQLPYRRSHCGVDTFDLEIDLIIYPDFSFEWKDVDDYNEGIERGVILNKWMQEIDKAKQEIFMKMEKREYPLDDSWLKWKPDVNWQQPKLPADWDKV